MNLNRKVAMVSLRPLRVGRRGREHPRIPHVGVSNPSLKLRIPLGLCLKNWVEAMGFGRGSSQVGCQSPGVPRGGLGSKGVTSTSFQGAPGHPPAGTKEPPFPEVT